MEIKVVFILLLICLKINIFKFLKYLFLLLCITFNKKPERAKKNKNVPKAPIATMINNDDVIMATPIFNT